LIKQDYILRQIELFGKGIARLLGLDDSSVHVLASVVSEDGAVSAEQYLGFTLSAMVMEGRICEAEDLLYETVEARPRPEYIGVAGAFYEMLANMGEDELAEKNFSYQEILDGMDGIKKLFGHAGH
jgi:hypothetical protein